MGLGDNRRGSGSEARDVVELVVATAACDNPTATKKDTTHIIKKNNTGTIKRYPGSTRSEANKKRYIRHTILLIAKRNKQKLQVQ